MSSLHTVNGAVHTTRAETRDTGGLPFSRWVQLVCPAPNRFVQRLILKENLRTGLDVGCGEYSILTALRPYGFRSVGIDVWPEQIEKVRRLDAHDEYIVGDVCMLDLGRQFDVVVLNHVIEHLPRDEGVELLRRLEGMAKRLLIVSTPNGFLEQLPVDGNPFQRHWSGWFPHDFEARGYTVFGSGLRCLRGPWGRAKYLPERGVQAVERLLSWYLFRHPRHAFAISAVRYIDQDGGLRQI